MRWHILRTLVHKEALRHGANRGGLVMVALLIAAAMLLSFFGADGGLSAGILGGLAPAVQRCYIDYWDDNSLVDHLRQHVPEEWKERVRFRPTDQLDLDDEGTIVYPPHTGAIQLRPGGHVYFWYPGSDRTALAPFEAWFWKEALYHYQAQTSAAPHHGDSLGPSLGRLEAEQAALTGGLDTRAGLATALVVFGLFLVCVYLMPSFTCEERERGVLLAQALSLAGPGEILAAKFLFYPPAALGLAAVLAGSYRPCVLLDGWFWLAAVAAVLGAMGVGLTIASLARTQRTASMAAMSYLLAVALVLFLCQRYSIPGLSYLFLEYHTPRMLHAALAGAMHGTYYIHLLSTLLLAVGWTAVAAMLFRRCGWQ
jgi:hypothetical protein